VLLDKTETLTLGVPSVQRVIPTPDSSRAEVLQLAASVEHLSEHPLAAAVQQAAKQQQLDLLEAKEFRYVVGRGVSATVRGKSVRSNFGDRDAHFEPLAEMLTRWEREANPRSAGKPRVFEA